MRRVGECVRHLAGRLGASVLAVPIFFSEPLPLAMPHAESAYLVEENGSRRLEDRYRHDDLWAADTVIGRWLDEDGRIFTLARAELLPPALVGGESTRADFYAEAARFDYKNDGQVRRVVEALSPVEPAAEFARPHQTPRSCDEVRYFEGTNLTQVVAAFRPRHVETWFYALWDLAEGDDIVSMRAAFEDEFLAPRQWEKLGAAAVTNRTAALKGKGERELLRADARHSVAAYPDWHFTDTEEFVILDDLRGDRAAITAITNELPALRARFAAAVPSPIDGFNTLAVARIFADRDEYLDSAEAGEWSAAYWSQSRRELVAYLPADGWGELRRTFRHEAFHQYLAYAGSMITASPWFNEGYAQYFEDEDDLDFGLEVESDRWDELEQALPALMMLGYADFYAGSDAQRRARYRLAKSIAVFIELGAPKVRFEPFKTLKADYIEALLKTHDMHEATMAAFGNLERLRLFASEWKRYWKDR